MFEVLHFINSCEICSNSLDHFNLLITLVGVSIGLSLDILFFQLWTQGLPGVSLKHAPYAPTYPKFHAPYAPMCPKLHAPTCPKFHALYVSKISRALCAHAP